MEYRNLEGERLQVTKKYLKSKGYNFIVTYNNTDDLFYFIDRFFKTKAGAEKFYNNLSCDKKDLKEF